MVSAAAKKRALSKKVCALTNTVAEANAPRPDRVLLSKAAADSKHQGRPIAVSITDESAAPIDQVQAQPEVGRYPRIQLLSSPNSHVAQMVTFGDHAG